MQEKKNINLKKFHKREIQSNYLVIKSEQKFDFNDFEYKITEVEVDYTSKDIIMIKGERVS